MDSAFVEQTAQPLSPDQGEGVRSPSSAVESHLTLAISSTERLKITEQDGRVPGSSPSTKRSRDQLGTTPPSRKLVKGIDVSSGKTSALPPPSLAWSPSLEELAQRLGAPSGTVPTSPPGRSTGSSAFAFNVENKAVAHQGTDLAGHKTPSPDNARRQAAALRSGRASEGKTNGHRRRESLPPKDLPDEVLTLLTEVHNEGIEVSEEMLEHVHPHEDGYRFTIRFPSGKQYEGVALKYGDKWFIAPRSVSQEICGKALQEIKRHMEHELDLSEESKQNLDEICIDHVLWEFEKDGEGLVSQYPLVFRFQNPLTDDELWCAVNPENGDMDAYSQRHVTTSTNHHV